MISNIARGTRTIFSAPTIVCCQCEDKASHSAPLVEMRAEVDGKLVTFYVHGPCLAHIAIASRN